MKMAVSLCIILVTSYFLLTIIQRNNTDDKKKAALLQTKNSYWLLLYRKSNIEFLYYGYSGNVHNSILLKIFKVKTGIPGERPTPRPELLGRKYWLVTDKLESKDNPETAPYFLTLDIPVSETEPFGPQPYLECSDPYSGEVKQCNWN